jgi:hypothetical protein
MEACHHPGQDLPDRRRHNGVFFRSSRRAGGDQADYYGCARPAVLKADGKWTEIKGPGGLEGKGWAVRRGLKNNLEAALKMELKLPGSR